jgi:DNA-binding GntR family transcriptional regulator
MTTSTPKVLPLSRVSTVDALGEALRTQILDGDRLPGTLLRELDLAEAYHVSRHTVRAALLQLAHDGLARHEPNRGAVVPKLSATEIEDLFALRAILELAAVDALVADPPSRASAETALAALVALPSDSSWAVLRDADLGIHAALIDGLGSSRASSVHAGILREVRLCSVALRDELATPDRVAEQHARIVDRIRARDHNGARESLTHHLESSLQKIVAAYVKA